MKLLVSSLLAVVQQVKTYWYFLHSFLSVIIFMHSFCLFALWLCSLCLYVLTDLYLFCFFFVFFNCAFDITENDCLPSFFKILNKGWMNENMNRFHSIRQRICVVKPSEWLFAIVEPDRRYEVWLKSNKQQFWLHGNFFNVIRQHLYGLFWGISD